MASTIEGGLQGLGQGLGQTLRVGWYFGLNRLVEREARRLAPPPVAATGQPAGHPAAGHR